MKRADIQTVEDAHQWARETRERIGPTPAIRSRPRTSNRAPIEFVRCPVHRQIVGLDGEGRILGRCWGCVRESANAIAKIERRA